ncbi:MAG: Rieske (2Fe-2S) protein [Bacteroidales bacterium]|jgi:cytochrome b6-f complex iron-sulfur subunit|nr:Rieske (2Fe-2S) protein [Bacteroidales bacterium]
MSKEDKKSTISRRKFVKYLLSGLIALEGAWLLFRSTGRRDNSQKESILHDAGPIVSFSNNQSHAFTSGQFNLIRYADGGFIALSTQCTHLGCIVNTNSDKSGFTCPCHSSSFDRHGEVLASPATRPLDTYPILFKEGHVWVDISKAIKRQKFEKEQLYYA